MDITRSGACGSHGTVEAVWVDLHERWHAQPTPAPPWHVCSWSVVSAVLTTCRALFALFFVKCSVTSGWREGILTCDTGRRSMAAGSVTVAGSWWSWSPLVLPGSSLSSLDVTLSFSVSIHWRAKKNGPLHETYEDTWRRHNECLCFRVTHRKPHKKRWVLWWKNNGFRTPRSWYGTLPMRLSRARPSAAAEEPHAEPWPSQAGCSSTAALLLGFSTSCLQPLKTCPHEALSLFRLCVTDLGKCEKHVHETLGSATRRPSKAHVTAHFSTPKSEDLFFFLKKKKGCSNMRLDWNQICSLDWTQRFFLFLNFSNRYCLIRESLPISIIFCGLERCKSERSWIEIRTCGSKINKHLTFRYFELLGEGKPTHMHAPIDPHGHIDEQSMRFQHLHCMCWRSVAVGIIPFFWSLIRVWCFFLRMLVSVLSQGCDMKTWIPPGVALAVPLDSRWKILQQVILSCEGSCFKKRAKLNSHFKNQPEDTSCIAQSFAVGRFAFSFLLRTLGIKLYCWEGQAPNKGTSLILPGNVSRIWCQFWQAPWCPAFRRGRGLKRNSKRSLSNVTTKNQEIVCSLMKMHDENVFLAAWRPSVNTFMKERIWHHRVDNVKLLQTLCSDADFCIQTWCKFQSCFQRVFFGFASTVIPSRVFFVPCKPRWVLSLLCGGRRRSCTARLSHCVAVLSLFSPLWVRCERPREISHNSTHTPRSVVFGTDFVWTLNNSKKFSHLMPVFKSTCLHHCREHRIVFDLSMSASAKRVQENARRARTCCHCLAMFQQCVVRIFSIWPVSLKVSRTLESESNADCLFLARRYTERGAKHKKKRNSWNHDSSYCTWQTGWWQNPILSLSKVLTIAPKHRMFLQLHSFHHCTE